jgi:hypothetical protein
MSVYDADRGEFRELAEIEKGSKEYCFFWEGRELEGKEVKEAIARAKENPKR